ncbi:MAG: D-alanyl-D-alanine carboxypeptidase [Ruminococcaceae bacterium]|nr:D-alanyl-D-alanine carboxypeptidase [Oscillospiraceae bacterium]
MRRFRLSAVCALLCAAVIFLPGRACAESAAESAQGDSAPRAALLMEAETGQVLYSVNAAEKLPMASITKVMSLLVLADFIDDGTLKLEDRVAASSYASSAEGSVIWLEPGEEMTAAELLEAVIVSSANDACIALAEHTAGSEAQFVKLMNRRAKSMGLRGTKFTGCVGFDAEGHYSTAEDIAVMTAELVQKEYYRGWLLTWLDYLRGGGTQLLNTNKLVRTYDGILGGKTGTTDGAGCCLTVCAERGGMRLVAVVLGCGEDPARFDRAEELLDYGFTGFEKYTPAVDSRELKPVPVTRGESPEVRPMVSTLGECVIKKGRSSGVKYSYTFVEGVEAPVEKGQFLGEFLVTLDGTEVFRSDIVAAAEVQRMTFGRYLLAVLGELVSF